MSDTEEPDFIRPAGAARRAHVGRDTVYRWLREGRLTRYKTGPGRGRTWISVSQLDALISLREETEPCAPGVPCADR